MEGRESPFGGDDQDEAALGVELKFKGMAAAAASRSELLAKARLIAIEFATKHGEVSADDIQKIIAPETLGNAAGSLFRGPRWHFTGRWTPSTKPSNHAHLNRIWSLKETA